MTAHYYEVGIASARLAVLHDEDICVDIYCAGCAPEVGDALGEPEESLVVVARSEQDVAAARSRADIPSEGLSCCVCCATIIPPMCSGHPAEWWPGDPCGFREDECRCEELREYDRETRESDEADYQRWRAS